MAITFRRGAGRLVLDRYDFQDHITGTNFTHNAETIPLSPFVNIDGYVATNVQSAINALSGFVLNIPDATNIAKGIIQLSGDLGGTATTPVVTKIQTRNVSTVPPNVGETLVWNSSAWEPAMINQFTPGNDLGGTYSSQNVIQISSNTLPVLSSLINFTSVYGNDVELKLVDGTTVSKRLRISTGDNSIQPDGNDLYVKIGKGTTYLGRYTLYQDTIPMFTCVDTGGIIPSMGLFTDGLGTSGADVLTNINKDRLLYVRSSDSALSAINLLTPNAGCYLFSYDQNMWVKPGGSSKAIKIGTPPNPQYLETDPGNVASLVVKVVNMINVSNDDTIDVFTAEANKVYKLHIEMIQSNGINFKSWDVYHMFYTDLSSITAVGTTTYSNIKNTAGASAWVDPTFTSSGLTLTLNAHVLAFDQISISCEIVIL